MKKILLMLLTGSLFIILGCTSAPVKTDNSVSYKDVKVTGKYFNLMSQAIYIELKDDGTFDDRFGNRSITGKYVVDGNRVILTPNTGKIYEYVIEGKSLIYKDGGRLTRQ
jgi:hypothetical protein